MAEVSGMLKGLLIETEGGQHFLSLLRVMVVFGIAVSRKLSYVVGWQQYPELTKILQSYQIPFSTHTFYLVV